jgi:uncharacterized protein YkuJ
VVDYPNGGETFYVGTTENLAWTSSGSATDSISYSNDNGATWTFVANVIPPTATYPWTVPNTPSASCFVKVSILDGAGGLLGEDVSDAVFEIKGVPTVTVTYPAGGETFYVGTVKNLTWTQDADVISDTVYYSNDNGATWTFVWGGAPIASYPWTVPNDPTLQARVRVIAVNPAGAGQGTSNVFEIKGVPTVTVTYPAGGETFYVGTVENLTWTQDADVIGDTVYYSNDNGATWTFVWGGAPIASYPWTVPNDPTVLARVRVIAVNPAGAGQGTSSVFEIKGVPTVTVTYPAGGETFYIGTSKTLTWTQDADVTGDTVYYSNDNGVTWNFVWGGPAATSHSWTVPNDPTVQARVRVIAVNPAGAGAGTSNVFTIKGAPTVAITYPAGGETFYAGNSENLTWTQDLDVTGDTVYYSNDNGATWNFVWGGPAATTYPWTVPNDPTALARVRVIAVNPGGSGQGISNVFTIASAPSVTITYPGGGELFYIGSVENLTWTQPLDVTGDTVYYSNDNGVTWNFVWGGPAATTYPWTVPNDPTVQARVRVIAINPGGPGIGVSNAFTIKGAPTVVVTFPVGGETFYIGTSRNLTWTQDADVTGDTVYYSNDNGVTWNFVWGGPAATTYPWTVPNDPTVQARIGVIAVNPGGSNQGLSGAFTIKGLAAVTVTSPNGGESWQVGSAHNITWTQDADVTGDTVYYSTDNGASWTFVWGGPATTIHPWNVPNTPTGQGRVRVIAVNPAGPSQDMSNAVFTIFSTAIFREDFNGAWTTTTPPPGWQIKYFGSPSVAAWHDEPDHGSNPWFSNTTRYAAIYYDYSQPGVHTDSLISPTINCDIYRNVTLRCSTFFRPDMIQPWTAKLMISSDNGVNWSTLFDYVDSLGPKVQSFDISTYADYNSLVKLLWVWQGDLVNLHWWALDNVQVNGTATYAHDISAGPIRRPRKNELPDNPFTPKAFFNNVGRNDEAGVQVGCELRDHDGVLVHSDVQTVSLARGESRLIPFVAPPLGLPADTAYRAAFFAITADDNSANDTVRRKFNVQDQVLFGYDDDIVAGDSHWTTGKAGWGLTVVADTTPAQILDARFNLHLPSPGTYYYKLRVVADDGADNAPGTTLYESGLLTAREGWNVDTLRDLRLYMWQDTFYIFYLQVNDWPDAAELSHDAVRSESVLYWKFANDAYTLDSLDADWMIRCSLNLAPVPLTSQTNARTVYVGAPDDELVLRPAGAGFAPAARVENFGGMPLFALPVLCTIYTRGGNPVYNSSASVADLQPTQGTYVTFAPWIPDFFDSARVVVRTVAPSDVDPSDDAKSKMVYIHQSHYTGFEALDRYAWIDNDTTGGPQYSWIDTTNAQVLIVAGIDIRVRVPFYPGFFNYFYRDTIYDQFYVCNNGWMAPGADPMTQTYQNLPLPDSNAPQPGLFPFWDNMYTRGSGSHSKVWWKIVTVGTNRRLVIIWQDMQFYGADTNDLVSFEVILEEGTGFTWFQYKDPVGGLASRNYGRSATVGIQNQDGHRGLQYLYGDAGPAGYYPGNKLTAGRAILFYPMRRDVGVTSIVQPARSYIRPQTILPQVTVKNFGSFIDPFYVRLRVNKTSDNSEVWRDSLLISSMSIGGETLVTFNPWTPLTGSYVLKCSTAMSGDADSLNNARSITLYVQSWLSEPNVPGGRYNKRVRAAAACYVDPYIYLLKGANTNEVWRYQTQTNVWDSIPSLPLGPKNKKTKDGCALTGSDNYVYAIKGGSTREFYRYDIAGRTWLTKDSVTSPYRMRNGSKLAMTTSAVYLLVGSNSYAFMKFDLALDTWRGDAPIEGGLMKKVKKGSSLTWDGGSYLYALKGGGTNEFWQYSIPGQRWITRESVPLGPRRKKVKTGSGAGYIAGRVYLTKGGNINEFWGYDITTRTWKQKTDVPFGPANKKVTTGGTATASQDAFYVFKGGNKVEFWSYGPGYDTLFSIGTRKDPSVQSGRVIPITEFSIRGGPNPFVNAAVVRLAIPRLTHATLKVYDISGQLVATLLDGMLPAGTRELVWNARDESQREVANGIYLLKFESPDFRATQKLILQR